MKTNKWSTLGITSSMAILLLGTQLQAKPSSLFSKKSDKSPILLEVSHTSLEEKIVFAEADELPALENQIAKMMQKNPKEAYASYLMSTLLLKSYLSEPGNLGLLKQSAELATQTFELAPAEDLGITALANILDATGEQNKGLELIKESRSLKIKPTWRLKAAYAKLIFNGKNSKKVLEILDEALEEPSASHKIIGQIIVALVVLNQDHILQIEELREWQKKCSAHTIDLALANALATTGQFKEALQVLDGILKTTPNHTEALLSQGFISLNSLADPKNALTKFRQVIEKTHNQEEKIIAKIQVAIALAFQKNFSKSSLSEMTAAISDSVEKETAFMAIYNQARKHGSTEQLLSYLDETIEKIPSLHLAYAIKGEVLSEKMRRYRESIPLYTDAIVLEPERSEYYDGRGLALMKMGNFNLARLDFDRATTVNPEDAVAHYNLACALSQLEKHEEALTSLQKAFAIDSRLSLAAQNDPDLDNLRSNPVFQTILDGDATAKLAH